MPSPRPPSRRTAPAPGPERGAHGSHGSRGGHGARTRGGSEERLQKVLARAGIASRRAAEELITAGRVRVDGKVVTELGTKVDPRGSVIEVDGKRAFAENLLYVVLHKPRNVVATMSDPEGRPTVRELIAKVPGRVYPVGRLDFATSGVLLATNDGDFAAELMHPRKAVPKTYIVKVAGTMEDGDLDAWRKGVRLEDGMTLPAKVKLVRHEEGEAAVHDRDDRDGRDGRDGRDDRGGRGGREGRGKTWFELTITEGRNQQIRRMGDATGFRVMRLARLAFAGITSEGLPPGAWRYLTWEELTALKKEWGVPKRVVSPPAQDAKESQEARRAHEPGRHHAGGPSARPRSDADRGRPARSGRGATSSSGARGARGARGPREADPRATVADSRGGPRYGGGAPVRRDLNVTEDWGGGVKRGSSGSRDPAQAPRDDVGGRGGRTRTTGSGGGIGAHGGQGSESSYRVKGRKGW